MFFGRAIARILSWRFYRISDWSVYTFCRRLLRNCYFERRKPQRDKCTNITRCTRIIQFHVLHFMQYLAP